MIEKLKHGSWPSFIDSSSGCRELMDVKEINSLAVSHLLIWQIYLSVGVIDGTGYSLKTLIGLISQPLLSDNWLRPRQNGRHFADDIFKYIFLNENVSISLKISLKFVPKVPINNILALVQIMTWRRPGDQPLSEPMMVSLLTHICFTRAQWVNWFEYCQHNRSCLVFCISRCPNMPYKCIVFIALCN